MAIYRKCNNGTLSPSLDQTVDLIIDLIGTSDTCFLCVDALDECNAETKEGILSIFSRILRAARNAKIFLIARTGELDVARRLGQPSSITISPENSINDINTYIEWRIQTGPSERLREIGYSFIDFCFI